MNDFKFPNKGIDQEKFVFCESYSELAGVQELFHMLKIKKENALKYIFYTEYEENKKKRLGGDMIPKRIKYKKLTRWIGESESKERREDFIV